MTSKDAGEESEEENDVMDEAEQQRVEALMKKKAGGQRGSILGESWKLEPMWTPPVYPKTPEQYARIEAACLKSWIFQALDPDNIKQVVNAFQGPTLANPGEQVIQEGAMVGTDEPALFMFESGQMGVFKAKAGVASPGVNVFTIDKPGHSFGEVALLYNCPRTATVVANVASRLWSINRTTFNACVKGAAAETRRKRIEFLKSVEIMKDLTDDEREKVAEVLTQRTFQTGERIMKQGDVGSEFFMLEKGTAYVTINGKRVKDYVPGEYFGELALIRRQPRAADVFAGSSPTQVAVLDDGSFTRLLGKLSDLMSTRANMYTKVATAPANGATSATPAQARSTVAARGDCAGGSGDPRGVFPTVDQRFSRFTSFKQVKTSFATLAYGHAGKPKVLWYDTAALVKRGALVTTFKVKGDIFDMDHSVIVCLFTYSFLCLLTGVGVTYWTNVNEFDSSKLESLSNYLNRFIPYILGLFVSLSLARWWAIRTEGLGRVLDSVQNIAMITATMLPGQDYGPYEDQLLKYGLASISLITSMCRPEKTKDCSGLGPKGDNLLTAAEVDAVNAIPYRAQPAVMWTWILLVTTQVMQENGVSPSKQRDMTLQVFAARDGIEKIITYMQSQLPFAYVHLVTLLVNLNNLVMSVKCGVIIAAQLENKNYSYAASQLIYLFTVPLLYQGLLSVSYVIHDPFGEDLLDFPVMAFQEYANEASVAMTHFTYTCPALKKSFGIPPTDYQRALLDGHGKAASKPNVKTEASPAQDMAVVKAANQRALQREQIAGIRAQIQLQDELIASLRKQNLVAASHVNDLNSKVATLEARSRPNSGALPAGMSG